MEMASALSSMKSFTTTIANLHGSSSSSSSSSSHLFFFRYPNGPKRKNTTLKLLKIRASSSSSETNPEDCNDEECAPDKEVGKISMEWVAEERTKVVGTFPPRTRGWTGYVEKDTAGQTNIYSVEPAVYVAESAISSGTAGSSSDGAENTAAIAAGIALISVAAASSILLQVSKNSPPEVKTVEYSGPSLSYYISKFKPLEITEASVPTEATPVQPEVSAPEPSEVQPQTLLADTSLPAQPETSAPEVSEVQTEPVS